MNEQDTDNEDDVDDSAQAATDQDNATDATDQAVEESIEEIAERPTGDVDRLLAEIADGDADSEEDTGNEQSINAENISIEDDLVSTIEDEPAEKIATAIVLLRAELDEASSRIDQLESELESECERADDLESRLKRKQADFQNYKKRQKERMEEEKQRATEDLVGRLLDVRDNLQRALDQDEDTEIRGGIESTLEQFNQELDKENVEVIEPAVGDETDPQRHEVLATVSSNQPEDTIASLHRPGYEMAGKVLRPAQVAVSDGSEANSGEKEDAS